MHAGRHYTVREVFFWTLRETLVFVVLGALPPLLFLGGVDLPEIAWPPVALLGTAVAFITGFKGNAAYNRLWEARQIWGGIVNASRVWASLVDHFVTGDGEASAAARKRLALRHFAWLTALRFQLREPRIWETQELPHNRDYQRRTFEVEERSAAIETVLAKYLEPAALERAKGKKNRAILLLHDQSAELRDLAAAGNLTELRHIELERVLATLVDLQGRSERIKNFPYPRQFATMNLIFVWLFVTILPFALVSLFDADPATVWLTLPSTVAIAWVVHSMDKIGEATENPFEAGPNDVPITAMSRSIEIDVRDMLGLGDAPPPLQPDRNILM